MRNKLLLYLASLHVRHPWRMLIFVLILTLFFALACGNLSVTMRWSDLLPAKDVHTLQFNKILEEFSTATSLVVVVQGEEKKIKAFADAIAPKILAIRDTSQNRQMLKEIADLKNKIKELDQDQNRQEKAEFQKLIAGKQLFINKKLVTRIDYKTELDFFKKYGLLLIKEDDLKNMQDTFTDANLPGLMKNINNSMEKEYIGRQESISNRQKEDQAVMLLDGIQDLVVLLQKYTNAETIPDSLAQRVVEKLLFGEHYMLSYDKQALIMNVIPTFSAMDIDLIMTCTQQVQGIVNAEALNHPGITAGLTGMVPLVHDEMFYSEKSLGATSIIAFIAILAMLILAFRMLAAPILAGINLLVGIIWAAGTAAITVGQLNMMTSMFAVILLGLGIDFSIHIITGFTENRGQGRNIKEALETTLKKNGRGIITGGVTTAIAFLALLISSSRGMKEMGMVSGLGLIAILISTLLLLPALLVLREMRLEKRAEGKQKLLKPQQIDFKFLGTTAKLLAGKPLISILAAIMITVFMVIKAVNISFDHNYMNMEAKGLTSIALQDTILDKFDLSMDYGLVLSADIQEARKIAKKYRDVGTVALVEDISQYLPSVEEQNARIPYIKNIKKALSARIINARITAAEVTNIIKELQRLEMNIIEMQDMAFIGGQDKVDSKCRELVGNPEDTVPQSKIAPLYYQIAKSPMQSAARLTPYQRQAAPFYKQSVLALCNAEPLSFTDLPESIKDRYCNKSRDMFLTTVFPSGNIWSDANFLNRFVDDLERTSNKATGMPPVFRALIQIIGSDGRKAILLTLIFMFFILMIDFRSPLYAILAMLPLAAGIFWMVGTMHLLNLQLTVINVMGLPLIIGIGIDDGVHIIHRWMAEGCNKLDLVFSSTGKAILLTSLTTMLGFGSLIFSVWRGFAQLGSAMFIGVAACFLTTIFILPGLLSLVKKGN